MKALLCYGVLGVVVIGLSRWASVLVRSSCAGLITSNSSAFSGVSGSSGSTWFLSQFFFSQAFFDRVVVDDPDDLNDFVLEWMEAYKQVSRIILESRNRDIDDTLQAARLLRDRGLTIAQFFTNMLQATSTAYGDPDFARREASPENRVSAFSNTSLYFQLSLAPVSRVPGFLGGKNVYVGASNASELSPQVYKVLLPYQFGVESSGSTFYVGVEPESLPFKMFTKRAKLGFRFKDWEEYSLYNGPETSGVILGEDRSLQVTSMNMSEPFRGKPTAVQVTVASSLSTVSLDGLSRASFAQWFSLDRFEISTSDAWVGKKARQRARLRLETNFFYRLADRLRWGACSQFPNECGLEDPQLGDGGNTDFHSLAMHLGRFADIPKVKVILTLTDAAIDQKTRVLAYFNTTFNKGVAPGAFLWNPSSDNTWSIANSNPTRSLQVFNEFLDAEMLKRILVPVLGADVSSARLNLTTVDNPAFGVIAGQEVDMLLLDYWDSKLLDYFLLGFDEVDEWKVTMAEAARNIAGNADLLGIVQNFVNS